jgi:hypothetical protein
MNANGTISLLLGAGDTHCERRQNCHHIIKLRPAQQGARQQPIALTRRINLHPGQSHAIALECIANGASGTLNDRGGLTTRQFVQQIDDRIFFGEALQCRFDEFDTLIRFQQE